MFWLSETQSLSFDDPLFNTGDKYSHFLYNIVIWAPGNLPNMERNVRTAIAAVDPTLVVNDVTPYSKIISGNFQQQNMIATLTSLFGILGLTLAALGLYGVLSYAVERRTNEIGLRMALGADRWNVIRMVMRGALWQVGIGLAIGIPLAVLAGKLIKDQLYGVQPWDPVMLTAATLLLAVAALVASAVPARRAAGVDPMVALRNE
jgi:putative ABC transport system permease protein